MSQSVINSRVAQWQSAAPRLRGRECGFDPRHDCRSEFKTHYIHIAVLLSVSGAEDNKCIGTEQSRVCLELTR